MAYKARKSGVRSGERVSPFARQQNLFAFDDGATVSDYTNATIMMLADIVNGAKVTELKKTISIYNDRARDAASGQSDIFSAELKTKEDILKEVNELLNYGTEEAKESALSRADASRRASSEPVGAESVEQDGTAGVSREGSADVEDSVQAALTAAEQETNTEPTEAQKEAGNYKKGHVKIDGYNITIENPKGSERSGQDKDGKKWSITMNNTYGYILGTEGVDGDHIDVFLSDNPSEGNVYIVDQVNADGSFDEHKVMYGFPDIDSARKAYLSNYEEGWQGLGNITGVSKEEFKKWVDSSHRKTKPFAEYSNVKPLGDTQAKETRETALRDGLIDKLRSAGIEVITDEEEAQRVLDAANGGVALNRGQKRAFETASVSSNEEHQPTVVSNADGAKVVKNLEKLAEEFENLSNQPKFFIGNVAKALGAEQYGSGSQYATFETKNGQIVTIRLADHNAHTSGFDYSGKDNGISIVISAKKNSGINNDGNAHIVEYYYDAIKLRRANGKPLADIVRAIQQSLYSGEFKDPTGLAEREEVNVSSTANEVKFLRTDSGEVYGFTKDGKIYIDPRKETAETPVHEFTHLWADGLRKANPKAWEQLKNELEKEKDLFDYVKSLYPELSGDDLMDEVFAHFSGRRGAERLRSEQEKMMQKANGIFDKAKITTMFDKLRNILHDFWAQARDLFAGKTEGIERLSAEDFADMALADLIKGEKPLVEGKKETRFNKAAGENKSLMGVHNISAEKLSKAIRQGGLANPSLAVIDTDERMHNDYGEISLIPKAELLNAKGGRNAGTYLGDAWTPTYPGVTQFITKQGEKHIEALAKQLANGNRDVELFVKSRLRDYAEQNGSSLHLAYLLARGKNPELKGKETKYSHEEYEALEDIFGEGVKDVNSDLTEEQHAKLKNLIMSFIEKDIEERSKDIQDAETRNKAKEYLREIREKAWFDEEGRLKFAKWDSYVNNVKRSERIRQNPEIDWSSTESEAHQRILKEGLTDDYNNWLQEVFDDGDIEEKLFAGFTPSGNRRYLPNTVENASKLMNRNSDTNAYDNGGFSATRSSLLQKVTTLAQIRKNKGKLKSSGEIEEKTSEMSDRLFNIISQIADMQKISDNRFMNTDYAESRLQDAITKRDPIRYLNEEYGYDIDNDSDLAKEINDFIKDTKELPVKYFETKFKRPVRLDEFAIAVVPENTSPDIVNSLKAAGLDVRTYDNSNQQISNEERERVTKEAVRERDDILFRNDYVSEYSFRTLRSDRFYNGISNSDAFAELLDENTSWVDGSLNLLRALKKRFGGEVVSASSGAKYALEHGLVPVPDGKYSGKDGEYHHIEFESDNGERFVESVPFVDAESVEEDYGIRYSVSDGRSADVEMNRAHDVAREWTEKLNLNDDVQIVDELTREMVDELMPNASEEVKEKALKAKGWFNEKTGKIVIAVGNHRNAEDVMQTILHEGVAHYGLRKLFGENFNTFLDNVYASADASVRKRIDVLQENKGYGRREAVEEYLAGLAEVTDFESDVSRTWWEKVKSLFADMLNSIGLSGFADNSLPLSDNELRYILWRSYDNLKSDNDVFRQAKDIAMQTELKVGNYEESKDATLGELVSGDSGKSDVRFRDDEDVYDAGRRSLEETLTQGLIDLSEKNRSDVGLRISAMKAISSNLSELRSAMSRQREYDKSTVNRIVRWARMLMESGIGGNLTRYEVKRLTGMIAQAAGKEDITRQAGQVMDLLINNQLRASKDLLQKQMRIKGSKIDSRGVEVQGALDIRGQRMIGAFKEGISLGEDAFYGLPVCRNIKRPFGNFRFATIAKSIPNSRMTQQRYYKILRTYVLHQDFRFVIVAFSVCCFYHVDAFWQVYHSSSADGMLLNDCSGNVVNVDDCLRRAVDHAFPVYVSCAEMLFVCHIFYFICFIFQCCDREYSWLIAVE